MAAARGRGSGENENILEELVDKAGVENLIGLKLYAQLTLGGKRLFEITAYDSEEKKFRVRDVVSGTEPSGFGVPLAEFEIGLASRNPDDPVIQLLEAHRIPVTPFFLRERVQNAGNFGRPAEGLENQQGRREDAAAPSRADGGAAAQSGRRSIPSAIGWNRLPTAKGARAVSREVQGSETSQQQPTVGQLLVRRGPQAAQQARKKARATQTA